MLKRYFDNLGKLLKKGRVLVIYGPRRVGKTTLLKKFLADSKGRKYKLDSGDNIRTQNVLSSQDFPEILNYVSGYDLIAIDEAQQIPNIGMGLKIIIDQSPDTLVIATGSSSFDLSQQIGEPLTGRKTVITLYPFSQKELNYKHNKYELRENLEKFLLFGSYPDVINAESADEKIKILNELADSYLLKDVLQMEKIKSSEILLNMLKLLAFQVGNPVSLNELAVQLKIDVKTVGKYMDLLEKSFVIKKVGGFSRNLRKEISKKPKYYFWDNGVRNAVISQFNALADRNDAGALFENFIVSELMKKRSYEDIFNTFYFWRTYDGKEIDLIEEGGGKLLAYEIKWSENKKVLAPKDWQSNYPEADFKVINRENYLDFLL